VLGLPYQWWVKTHQKSPKGCIICNPLRGLCHKNWTTFRGLSKILVNCAWMLGCLTMSDHVIAQITHGLSFQTKDLSNARHLVRQVLNTVLSRVTCNNWTGHEMAQLSMTDLDVSGWKNLVMACSLSKCNSDHPVLDHLFDRPDLSPRDILPSNSDSHKTMPYGKQASN